MWKKARDICSDEHKAWITNWTGKQSMRYIVQAGARSEGTWSSKEGGQVGRGILGYCEDVKDSEEEGGLGGKEKAKAD